MDKGFDAKCSTKWWVEDVFKVNSALLRSGRDPQVVIRNVRACVKELSGCVRVKEIKRCTAGGIELVMREGIMRWSVGYYGRTSLFPYGLPKEYDIKVNDLNNLE